jgi:hypothetical protein
MQRELKLIAVLAIIVVVVVSDTPCWAQQNAAAENAQPTKISGSYRLEFTVMEVEDGKTLNSRTYTMMLSGTPLGQVRAGSRVPLETGGKRNSIEPMSSQYFDTGQNIDCRIVAEHGQYLVLDTSLDMSTLAPARPGGELSMSNGYPIIRQLKARTWGAVDLGKPTVITSLDDLSTSRRFRLEVLVTRVK